MKEPLSLRLSDSSDPKRGMKLEAVLRRRCVNPSEMFRQLADAFIESDGIVEFPVRLISMNGHGKRRAPPAARL